MPVSADVHTDQAESRHFAKNGASLDQAEHWPHPELGR